MSGSGGNCWHCGKELGPLDYGRQDSCPGCGRDTRACKGCANYEPSADNSCREPQAERVVDKERANFCDYFKPRAGAASAASRDAMKAAAEALCNTVATCRKFYVHPGLIQAYADGRLLKCFERAERDKLPRELKLSERAVLGFLRMSRGA